MLAFTMVVVEVFTSNLPFEGPKKEAAMVLVTGGTRLEKPQKASDVGLTDDMWNFLQTYWMQNPSSRPSVEKVVMRKPGV